jgi:plastocyanin
MTRTALLISSFLFLAAVLIGCGGTNESQPSETSATGQSSMTEMPASTSAPNSPAAQADSQIVISNMAYTVPTSVRPGQQLTIVNKDDPNHTVTADENNLFDVRISGGGGIKSFTAPTISGNYPFHCKYHANMHGTLTVQ